jgi:KDO2-lipid IV(A) lauroyltransferase
MKIKYRLQYGALRLLWGGLGLLPLSRAYGFGCALGRLWFALDRRRRRIACTNIRAAGFAASAPDAARLARASFGHFLGHLIESLRLPADAARFGNDRVEIEAPPESVTLMTEPGAPVLMVSGHLGCWETALRMLPGRPVMVVARTLNNPLVQRFLTQTHFRGNVTLIPKQRGLSPDVIRRWRAEKSALILLMDQHAGRHGIWLDFFGRPASTHTSPARLHLMTGIPIVPLAFVRVGPLRYRLIADAPIRFAATDDRDADQRAILVDLSRRLETFIRRYPAQYLWAHRRWRQPPVTSLPTERSGEGN